MIFKTYDEAAEYVDQARESESEQRAEYGSGAVSLGYDPAEWAPAYEGYRTSDDPTFAEADRLLRDRYSVVKVVIRDPRAPIIDTSDDIPF
jgi:hypothetical protein